MYNHRKKSMTEYKTNQPDMETREMQMSRLSCKSIKNEGSKPAPKTVLLKR